MGLAAISQLVRLRAGGGSMSSVNKIRLDYASPDLRQTLPVGSLTARFHLSSLLVGLALAGAYVACNAAN